LRRPQHLAKRIASAEVTVIRSRQRHFLFPCGKNSTEPLANQPIWKSAKEECMIGFLIFIAFCIYIWADANADAAHERRFRAIAQKRCEENKKLWREHWEMERSLAQSEQSRHCG
jgi:hypothetical protein